MAFLVPVCSLWFVSNQDVDGNNNKGELLAQKCWEAQLGKNGRSIVTDLFSGQSRSTVECLTCGTKSYTYEQFQCLTLPIPETASLKGKFVVTIEECLVAYLSREIVGSHVASQHEEEEQPLQAQSPSSKWRCPKCKVPRDFSKKIVSLKCQ
jgi:ubiquitin C-terminal hydrolase